LKDDGPLGCKNVVNLEDDLDVVALPIGEATHDALKGNHPKANGPTTMLLQMYLMFEWGELDQEETGQALYEPDKIREYQ
jgi:hypothetical protein